jgi:GDP-L-fucose synthase
MNIYKDKSVLVTGGTGMIGRPLVEKLLDLGAEVRVASLDDPSLADPRTDFHQTNLLRFENCEKICRNIDYVFQLAGIKGSPLMTKIKPASFFVPTILMNLNMMEASRQNNVDRYLYTSSIGVYAPAPVFHEDDVWKTFPSENDKFAGWAKRMGELQAEAYKIEYDWKNIAIVRPANVYGPYDNFDPRNAMVIPSLIRRAADGENPFTVWGDGTPIRDFIHAYDVADGMLLALEKGVGEAYNLGSGTGISIKDLVLIIMANLDEKPDIAWDLSKPSGDKIRVMDISKAKRIGYKPRVSFEDGISQVMKWYIENKSEINKRYNVFSTCLARQ